MTQHKLLTALVAVVALVGIASAGVTAVEVLNEEIEVDDGETVMTDIKVTDEFTNDSKTETTISVQLLGDAGTEVNATNLTVTESDFGDGESTVWRTVEFEPALNGTFNVSVDANQSAYVNRTEVSVEGPTTAGGGLVGGASSQSLIGFVVVVGGLVYAYREDYL